mmetsp:Transcript_36506/g.85587  ORF Transcript_36506/g.85587 Transcript_36506/m.85587 type:complete len:103 (+) Transcript_36506:2418-2726(+)
MLQIARLLVLPRFVRRMAGDIGQATLGLLRPQFPQASTIPAPAVPWDWIFLVVSSAWTIAVPIQSWLRKRSGRASHGDSRRLAGVIRWLRRAHAVAQVRLTY